jgi:hypothetical protein
VSVAHRPNERDPRETRLQGALLMSDREREMYDLITEFRSGPRSAGVADPGGISDQLRQGARRLLRAEGAPAHAISLMARRDRGRWHVSVQGLDDEAAGVECGTRAEAEAVIQLVLGRLLDWSELDAD